MFQPLHGVHVLFDAYPLHLATVSHPIVLLIFFFWWINHVGWYRGERLRDDERGWFPGNYTVEIASAHVRARNLRQRYRLLALSGSFIEEQARKDKEENKRKSKKLSLTNE